MSTNVQSCSSYETLNTAAHRMWEADIGVVAVLDDKQRLVGMITDRDVCMGAYLHGRPLGEIPLLHVMSHEVVSCRAEDTLRDAEELMRSRQLRRLPVVDAERHVVGIISLNDIVRAVARSRRGQGELIETLSAISQPRTAAQDRAS